jgi:hypothetical protein
VPPLLLDFLPIALLTLLLHTANTSVVCVCVLKPSVAASLAHPPTPALATALDNMLLKFLQRTIHPSL